jgi:protein-tyrosine phosphatase
VIDLHCHLLAGIDDGPATMDESLELARIAVADGISHCVVTPHIHPGRWDNAAESIALHCQELRSALEQQGIALQLGYAAEVRLGEHILEAVTAMKIPFYGELDGQQVMLLEFPHGHILPGSEQLISWLLGKNIRPMIAHPERNRELMRNPDRISPFVQLGCLLQVTGGSLLGQFGEPAMDMARWLMRQDMVYVVASDGHNSGPRPPRLLESMQWVRSEFGEQRAQRLYRENPSRLVKAQFPDLG